MRRYIGESWNYQKVNLSSFHISHTYSTLCGHFSINLSFVLLSTELKMGNVEHADHIHVALMVDHAAICSPWMVGVRKLVQHLKSSAPPPPAITAPIVSTPVTEGEGPIELVVVPTSDT